MTSHTELVRDVVKQFGVVALAKSMVQDQKSYGLDEPTFTQLATEHAQRLYPNDRPDVAFSKLYQGEESVRRACAVLKAAPWVEPIRADVQPVMVGGVDATHEAINSTESSEAYRQLQELGQQRWANERSDVQFARAFEANPELARKAHVRPSATTSYEFPR